LGAKQQAKNVQSWPQVFPGLMTPSAKVGLTLVLLIKWRHMGLSKCTLFTCGVVIKFVKIHCNKIKKMWRTTKHLMKEDSVLLTKLRYMICTYVVYIVHMWNWYYNRLMVLQFNVNSRFLQTFTTIFCYLKYLDFKLSKSRSGAKKPFSFN
jgi:hypothetical protein